MFSSKGGAYASAYVGKDIEVRPGRVTHRNVKRNHNVIIYCHARHCGCLLRGRCDGSVEEEKTHFASPSNESDHHHVIIRFISILAII